MTAIAANAGSAAQDGATSRDAQIQEHMGLVHHLVSRLMRNMSSNVEAEDLVGAGIIGLIQALDAFDASRGHTFSTFAVPRIRGAILDELRRRDHAPRSVRRKMRRMSAAETRLRSQLGREPTTSEVAAEAGVDDETIWRWRSEVELSRASSLENASGDFGHAPVADVALPWVGEAASPAEDTLTHEEEVDHLRRAILELPEQDRVVLALYYFEELKMHQIGQVLGLSEARISQIHSRAKKRLKSRLSHLREAA